ELNGLAGRLQQLAQLLTCGVGDVHPPADQRAELEQRQAEPVFARLVVLLEKARRGQRRGEAMHGAFRQAQAPGERGDAELVLLARERAEQPDRVGDGRKPRLGGAAHLRNSPCQIFSHLSCSSSTVTGSTTV